MFRKLLAVMALLVGCTIGGWIGYNYLVEMQPAAEGRNPMVPSLFALAMIGWGFATLTRGKGTPGSGSAD